MKFGGAERNCSVFVM